MEYLDPRGKKVTRDQAMIGGCLRAGYHEILGDGEYVRMSLSLIDSASGRNSVYLTDTKPAGVDPVEACRRQWLADKANAYRGPRLLPTKTAQPQRPALNSQPAPFNDAAARRSLEAARRQWLADKENAHRPSRGEY